MSFALTNQLDELSPKDLNHENVLSGSTCQVCKLDRYLQPDVKILVSVCFHHICEKCIGLVFRHGSAPCPVCKRMIKRLDLQSQTFEDLYVEREVRIRKRVLRIYNRRRDDFPNTRAYDDYLEQVEDIISNLSQDIDVEATEAKIERYRRENHEIITRNSQRSANENAALVVYVEQERLRRERSREMYREALEREDEERVAEKEAILNELASSNRSANEILALHAERSSRTMSFIRAPDILPSLELSEDPLAQALVNPFETLEYDDTFEMFFDLANTYVDPLFEQFVANSQFTSGGGFKIEQCHLRCIESVFKGLFVNKNATE